MPDTILCKTKSLVLWSLHSSGIWRQKTNSNIKPESGKCYEKNLRQKNRKHYGGETALLHSVVRESLR